MYSLGNTLKHKFITYSKPRYWKYRLYFGFRCLGFLFPTAFVLFQFCIFTQNTNTSRFESETSMCRILSTIKHKSDKKMKHVIPETSKVSQKHEKQRFTFVRIFSYRKIANRLLLSFWMSTGLRSPESSKSNIFCRSSLVFWTVCSGIDQSVCIYNTPISKLQTLHVSFMIDFGTI